MKTKAVSLVVLGLIVVDFGSARGAEPPKPVPAQPAIAPNSVFFLRDVMPLLNKLGCNQAKCHGSLQGKGGFQLSMFASNPADDYSALTKAAAGKRINKVEPSKSLFLLKATASIAHEGRRQSRSKWGRRSTTCLLPGSLKAHLGAMRNSRNFFPLPLFPGSTRCKKARPGSFR